MNMCLLVFLMSWNSFCCFLERVGRDMVFIEVEGGYGVFYYVMFWFFVWDVDVWCFFRLFF